jgi:hypothetical protein
MNFMLTNVNTGRGIFISPTSGNHNISVTNTTASNNQFAGVYYLPPSGSTASTGIVIDRVTANNNGFGIAVVNSGSSGATTASISNSIASFDSADGFYFADVTASLDASNASSNGINGVLVAPGATLALGRSVLMNNGGFGLSSDGTVNTYKDNRIAGK